MRKKIIACLSVISVILGLFMLTYCTIQEGPNYFWVAGKTMAMSPIPTVADFPVVFPQLYYKEEHVDPSYATDQLQTLRSDPTRLPYYEMQVAMRWSDDAPDYQKSTVWYFMMIGGKPGNMDVCGITFGMTKEEVENTIQELNEKMRRKIVGNGLVDHTAVEEALQYLELPEESLTCIEYVFHKPVTIIYKNNKVFGIYIHFQTLSES